MHTKVGIHCLALSLLLVGVATTAYADPDAPKPYTASELPIMATTPNLIYGTYGPQLKLGSPTFQSIPDPIYLDKALEEQLTQGSVHVDSLSVQYNSLLKLENEQQWNSQDLTLDAVKTLAQHYLQKTKAEGYFCDAVVSVKGKELSIILTPMSVESVDIQAEDGWQKRTLTHLLRGIETNAPLDLSFVEKQLRLIQANPDLSFTSELEVLPYTHQVKIKVTSSEHKKPFHVVASVNNLDQIIFGRGFAALTAVTNNVTGNGDSLMASVVRGYRSTGGFTRYEIPIKPQLRAFIEGQYADIEPYDIHYIGFETEGFAYRISPGLKYVFMDKPNKRLSADLTFDFKQSNTSSGPDPIEREAVRTIRAGINYDQQWEKTALSMRHELAEGLPILSGSLSTDPRLSWFRGGSQYIRYTGYSTLTRQLPWDSTGSLNLQWQYTPDGLSNFDVGGLGGTFYGRGYREVYIFVDTYAILNAQWQFPAKFIPKGWKLPFSDKDLRDATQFLAFVDYGYGDTTHSPTGYDGNDHILSTGVGVRTQLTNRISGRLDIGFPLLREVPFSQGARLHFGVDTVIF